MARSVSTDLVAAEVPPSAPSAEPRRASEEARWRELSAEVNRRLAAWGVRAVSEFRSVPEGGAELVVRPFGPGSEGASEITARMPTEPVAEEAWISGIVRQIALRVATLVPPGAGRSVDESAAGPFWCSPG